nr:hypothetical protein [Tanacetum cinerariifolium]
MGNVKKFVFERARHQRQYDRRVNKRLMQTQESKIDLGKAVNDDLVVTKSSGTESEVQDDNSRSGNDTDADNADIRPIYDEEPMAKVQLNAECNIFAIGQQHTEQPEIINEEQTTSLLANNADLKAQIQKKVDLVVTESSGIESEVQDDNSRSRNDTDDTDIRPIYDEEPMAKVQLNAECNIFVIGQQHTEQPEIINEGQHGQVLNAESNKAKIKKEIDVLEIINIELEHKVANLRKENETLKKHYKDLYDSIKNTRTKTIEQTTFLLANNFDLKDQIQEKVFAIAALKNDLRKLKENSVDTKFAITLVLGKPVLQPLRNQSVVRQLNAFKHER